MKTSFSFFLDNFTLLWSIADLEIFKSNFYISSYKCHYDKTNFHCHIFSHRLLLSKRSTFISQINPLTSRYDECYPPDIEEKLKSCRSLAFSLSTRLIWRLLARCVKWSENICNKDCGRSDASNIRHVIFVSATFFGFRSNHWKRHSKLRVDQLLSNQLFK